MSSIDIRNFGLPPEGLGFVAQYFLLSQPASNLDEINFETSPDAVEVVAALNTQGSSDPFWEGGTDDLFAARYVGTLNVETAGEYTIYLTSDDGSALYIDGRKVIDNDGRHASTIIPVTLDLAAGAHDIEIRYFEAWGAQTLKLEWNGPDTGGETQLMGSDAISYTAQDVSGDTAQSAEQPTTSDDTGADDHAQSSLGLEAKFFALQSSVSSLDEIDFGVDPDAKKVLSEISYEKSLDAWWEGGSRDRFAAELTGYLNVETAGEYTIYLTSDDGSALYIDGRKVIDNDGRHASTVIPVTLNLVAGAHDIEIRYFEAWGAQTLKLEWNGPDTNGITQLIGGDSLTHMSPAHDDGNDHGGHGDTGADDGNDHGGHDDTGADDGNDHGGHDDTGADDGNDHGGHDDTGADDGNDHGGHDDTGADDGNDHGGHDDTGADDGNDHGGHGDTGADDGNDHGGHDDTGADDGNDHGGHDDMSDVDHGGDTIPGSIPEPTSPDEVDAFVAAVMAEPNAHAHGGDASKATEHGQMLDLVPRSEATHVAVSDGDWFDPNTWHEGRIPDANAKVLIPKNIAVNYNGESDASLFTVRVDGELSFATNIDTKIVVDTLVVDTSGRLEIGTADNPIAANVTTDIVIANNGDIDVSWDPSLLSRGVISHGQVEIHGADKDAYLKVSDAPMTGDTSLTLAEIPDGWQVGDKLVISGTHKTGWTGTSQGYVESQDEEVTITAINGNQITFDRALQYDHDTPRDDLFAYVANMSRNITFSSEDGDATQTHHRGHVMFMHNDDVDVRYAAFEDLGRTDKSVPAFDVGSLTSVEADSNVKGRYSFHFHRTGTTDQENPAMAVGNTVDGSPGWGFVHHSSNANFTDNVAFDVFGAAFAAEAGDETGAWIGNMAIRSEGVGYGSWKVKEGSNVLRQDTGHTGDGFFFAGRLVEAAENVAINTTNGFVWMHRNNIADPLSENLDHPEIAYGTETVGVNLTPIQGFRDNEAFGTHTGLMVIKSTAEQGQHDMRSVFDGFTNWETNVGVDISYTAHYTLLNFDLISTDDRAGSLASTGIEFGTNTYDMVVNGLKVEGFDQGVDLDQTFHFPMQDQDIRHIIIDLETIDVGTDIYGFDSRKHQLLTSDDLTPGRMEFVHNGDTSLAVGEDFSLDGVKTDSIGTINRENGHEPLEIGFYEHIIYLISNEGYYKTTDGRNVILIEDFLTDRATGEVTKISHVVTLEMTDRQIAGNWTINNYTNGAKFNGIIDLGGAPVFTRDDTASTQSDQGVLIDVLANDTDPEGALLRVDGFIDPEHGDVYLQDNGQLLYVPNVGFSGSDTFSYWATDDAGNYSQADVVVDVWDL